MSIRNKGVYIYANLLDINQNGEIDMVSFLSPDGKGIALAVRNEKSKKIRIHMLQDSTGDGKLDNNDINIINREAKKIFDNNNLNEEQLRLYLADAEYG